MVMSQSSYAKIAGLQSEVGRVVVTRVAGSELEYKKTVNMYRKDITCTVNNIRREQIKMKRKMNRYGKKLKLARRENEKRKQDEIRRDRERAELEELHLRLKLEAQSQPEDKSNKKKVEFAEDVTDDTEDAVISPSEIDVTDKTVYIQTGNKDEQFQNFPQAEENNHEKTDELSKQRRKSRKEVRSFSPMLPMINEDAEKDEVFVETERVSTPHVDTTNSVETDRFDRFSDDMSVSSYGGRRKKKKRGVSFSDIIKLKYASTKRLFDLVNVMAKKHGIPDVVEQVPDPRDNIVHRGSTHDTLRLQAAVLYPMKYGYITDEVNEEVEPVEQEDGSISTSKSPALSVTVNVTEVEGLTEMDLMEDKAHRLRRQSLEQQRAIFSAGQHSKPIGGDFLDGSQSETPGSPRKLKSSDLSLPALSNKVSKIKAEQNDRLSERVRADSYQKSSLNLLAAHKPSSSRSSRSLPVIERQSSRPEKEISWTQAFGLLRAIHSLEDVS